MKRTTHNNRWVALLVGVLLVLVPLQASAGQRKGDKRKPDRNEIIVRAEAGKLAAILAENGLDSAEVLTDAETGEDLALVVAADWEDTDTVVANLLADPDVTGAEGVELTSLPEQFDDIFLDQSTMALLDAAERTDTMAFDGRSIWAGYVDQPAARLLHVDHALKKATGVGAIVAIIDTGIDSTHGILDGHVIAGYDFLLNEAGLASDRVLLDQSTMALLDQSTMALLDQSTMALLDQSTIALLDQSTMALLDQSTMALLDQAGVVLPPSLGHGTLVAGIVHRVAPDAMLMPLRVFDGNGSASSFDIIKAILYAVNGGATVINMSFHLENLPYELERAIDFATRHGVVCVGAAGNHGISEIVYPAALTKAIGVGATDDADWRASFSNYGDDLVYLAAPGVSIITSWVGGGWAAASGTSFSAPWIAGGVALFADKNGDGGPGSIDFKESLKALRHADKILGPTVPGYVDDSDSDSDGPSQRAMKYGMGFGRAQLHRAIDKVKKPKKRYESMAGSLDEYFAEWEAATIYDSGTADVIADAQASDVLENRTDEIAADTAEMEADAAAAAEGDTTDYEAIATAWWNWLFGMFFGE